jgi:hypothetical protein
MKRIQKAKLPLTLLFAALAMVCVAALAPSPAQAVLITLTDGNSQVTVDSSNDNGMTNWKVGDLSYMVKESFYFRQTIGGVDGAVTPVGNLNLASVVYNASAPGDLTLNYTTAAGPNSFAISLGFSLVASPLGNVADIQEQLQVTNTGAVPLTIRFYEYADFNLSNGLDKGKILGAGGLPIVAEQYYQTSVLNESLTSELPQPNKWEMNTPGVVMAAVLAAALNQTPALDTETGPGDLAWAMAWDMNLDPGKNEVISKDKHLVVPIPPSALLLGSGLLGLVGIRLKRRA